METVKLFEKYYKRLAREGLTKSVLCGLLVGFSAMLVAAFCFWMAGTGLFWLAVIPFILGTAVSAPVFYYRKFKPTSSAVAARIDELGLEERMITMNELKNDDSYIARRQREDAVKSLGLVKADLIRLAVSVPLIVAVAVLGIAGLGMTTVSALAANEVVSSGKDVIEDISKKPPVYFDVQYEIEGDGEIIGSEIQRVENGKGGTEVTAVANDGYAFVGWYIALDGKNVYNGAVLVSDKPVHAATEVTENLTIFAVFQEVEEGEDGGDGEGEGEEGEDGEQGDPGEPGEPGQGNQSSKPGEGTGNGAGGDYNGNDYIIDGKTDYGDYIGDASQNATEGAKGDSNLSGKGQDAIGGYFGNIGN